METRELPFDMFKPATIQIIKSMGKRGVKLTIEEVAEFLHKKRDPRNAILREALEMYINHLILQREDAEFGELVSCAFYDFGIYYDAAERLQMLASR